MAKSTLETASLRSGSRSETKPLLRAFHHRIPVSATAQVDWEWPAETGASVGQVAGAPVARFLIRWRVIACSPWLLSGD